MLTNKNIFITGASRGIGSAIARLCAENGARVIINYNESEKEAEELLKHLSNKGLNATILKGDISIEDDVQRMAMFVKNKFGGIDVLINNAGIAISNSIILISNDDFDKIVNINCKGVFLCTKYFSKMMMKQKSGKIINISSVFGIEGSQGQAIYSGSKAFVNGFTKSLAKELGCYGIMVNAIAPGIIDTDLNKNMRMEMRDKYIKNTALGRIGIPDDIASVVLFLASNLSDFITGQIIRVDGGIYSIK